MHRLKMSLFKKVIHHSLSKVIQQINSLMKIILQIQKILLTMVQILKITLLAIIQLLQMTILTPLKQVSKKLIIRIHLTRLRIDQKNKMMRLKLQVTLPHQPLSLQSTWLSLFPRFRNLPIGIDLLLRWTLLLKISPLLYWRTPTARDFKRTYSLTKSYTGQMMSCSSKFTY